MPATRIPLSRLVRWTIQLLLLALFVVFFARTAYGVSPVAGDLFLRFDPLVLLVSSIALRTVVSAALLALVTLALTLVFGRFFCGFFCPLGTAIDLFDSLLRRPKIRASRLQYLKYGVLLLLIAAAGFGASFIAWFDPLATSERVLTLVFHPAGTRIAALFGMTRVQHYSELVIALASFAAILGLSLIAPRFWCRNLCPLGGIFALVSKVSLFKFSFAAECRDCGLCEGVCPTGAIVSARRGIDSGECIMCLACRYRCSTHSVSYRPCARPVGFDPGRREALVTLGSALVLASYAAKLARPRQNPELIRPPGALPEPEFLDACIRCERCMKACPTNGLQPCVFETGLNGIWTPRLVPRSGPCERNCNLCGRVCPTGALRRLSLEEKTYAKLGNAVIDQTRCIAWAENLVCLICDEACPYNAIDSFSKVVDGTDLLRPYVNEHYCVGCGVCEFRCPVKGAAAIRVFAHGEDRRRCGSYKTGGTLLRRECGDTPEEDVPSGFIQE